MKIFKNALAITLIAGIAFTANAATENTAQAARNNYYAPASITVYTPTAKQTFAVNEPKMISEVLNTNKLDIQNYLTPAKEVIQDRTMQSGEQTTFVAKDFKSYVRDVTVNVAPKTVGKLSWMPVGAYKTVKSGVAGKGKETMTLIPDPLNPAAVIESRSTRVTKAAVAQQRQIGTGTASKIKSLKCTNGSKISSKTRTWGKVAYQNSCRLWPKVKHYSSYRPGPKEQDHGTGNALDLMTYSNYGQGDKIASFFKRHHKAYNVKYIIWKQRIWAPYRADEGWRKMEDRGSKTANHYDHVHLSFY